MGFTLIELLVVTGIIVVISTIILANNNRFGGAVLLENLGYDIALSMRQAQVYGISVRRFGAGTFSAGYGVHFDLSSPDTYVLFADLANTGIFNPTTNANEVVQTTAISSGYRILQLCAPEGADAATCTSVPHLDITFLHPEPDAWISAGNSCLYGQGTCMESARVVITSPRGDTMSVIIEANGQISVRRI